MGRPRNIVKPAIAPSRIVQPKGRARAVVPKLGNIPRIEAFIAAAFSGVPA
jgi:hypothetical protein